MHKKSSSNTFFIFVIAILFSGSLNAQFCSGLTTLTATNGNFNDGSGSSNYANNSNCSWLIQPPGNPANITFTMDTLNLSGFTDAVRVYDGTNASGTLIAIYRGNNLGNAVIANSGSMFVQFTSNGFGNAQGWAASYTSSITNCQPNTIITANAGAFTDGTRNGSNYANNTNCEWLLQPTAPGVFIEVNFSRYTLGGGDSLILYDGINSSAPVLASLVGAANPGTYRTTGGNLFVRFSTNTVGTANGWRIVYNTQPIPFCNGLTTLTSPNGLFNDGSFRFTNYVENSNCQWLIQPPGALSVDLQFNYFSTEANFDLVNVYQGTNNNGVLLGSFSGNNIPPLVTSTTGAMFVEFTTDGAVNSTGWEGNYTSSNVANITASLDTIYLNAGAGSTNSFQVTANASWITTDNQGWLISSPVNGTGNQSINILAIQGNIGPERTAQLYINASNGNGGDTVTVIQRSSGRFLDIPVDTLFFSATNAASQSFSLLANVSWTLTNSSSWISASPLSGMNNVSPLVSVNANSTNQIRTGYLIANGTQNAGNDTIVIVQDSLPRSFSVAPKSVFLNATAGSLDSIQINANLAWNLSNNAAWLTESVSSGSDTSVVILTANSANLTFADRSTYIYFDAGNGRFIDSVLVTQYFLPQNFSVNPNSINLNSTSGSSDSVIVYADLAWVISNSVTWIGTNVTSGNDTTSVIITANSANPSLTDRSSYLYFNAGNGKFIDSVLVSQKGIPPFLAGSPDTAVVSMGSGEMASFTISASGNWTVSSSSNWITIDKLNGSGNDVITASTTSINTTNNSRVAALYLNDATNNISDTLVLIQSSASGTLAVTPSQLNLASANASTASFIINSDISWSISGVPAWLNLSASSGTNNSAITVTTNSANQSGSDRVANLVIAGQGAVSKSVTVTQVDVGSSAFLLSVDTLFIGSTTGSLANFTIIANSNWTLSESSFWLALNKTSGANTEIITARAGSNNLFGTPRFTTVTASSVGLSDQTMVVGQLGAPLSFSYAPDSLVIGADSASFGKFNITSNLASWNVSVSQNWLQVSPVNGSLTDEVLVKAIRPNNTGLPRSALVTISSPPFTPLLAKVVQDTIRSIGILERTLDQQVSIYPNPSRDVVHVKFESGLDQSNAIVEVYDVVGKQVTYEVSILSKEHLVFNLSEQQNGFYFIKILIGERSIVKKILILAN